jgi:hypothetical protein
MKWFCHREALVHDGALDEEHFLVWTFDDDRSDPIYVGQFRRFEDAERACGPGVFPVVEEPMALKDLRRELAEEAAEAKPPITRKELAELIATELQVEHGPGRRSYRIADAVLSALRGRST